MNKTYRHVVNIFRLTSTITNNVKQKSFTKVASTMGNLQVLSGDAVIIGDSQLVLANHRLFCAVGIDIKPLDELEVNGIRYIIYNVDNLMLSHSELLLKNKV